MAASPGGVEVGRVSVRVLPDTARFGADLDVALRRIEATTELKVNATIDNARLDAEARAAVDQAQLAAGDINIKTNVDTSQVREAESVFGRASSAAASFSGSIGAITAAVLILGPTLVPLVATLGLVAGALVAPLAVAGGGFTLFAVLTGAVIKQTETQQKQIVALKTAVDSARQSLVNTQAAASASASASTASAKASADASLKSARQSLALATTASAKASAQARIQAAQTALHNRQTAISTSQNNSVAAAQLRVTEAVAKYQAALAALTPAQNKFLAAQASVKSAFQTLIVTTGPALLGPVTEVLNVVASIIPAIKPILTTVSTVITQIIGQFASFAQSSGFKSFVRAFAAQLGPDLRAFAAIGINVLEGLIGLFGALGKAIGGPVLAGLVRVTGSFNRFGQSVGRTKGFKSFVDYVTKVGPLVARALGAIATAFAHIVEAAAPIGTVVLKSVVGLADAVNRIPIRNLTLLIAGMASLAAAAKLAGPIGAVLGALATPEIAAAVVGVVALAGGFYLLYQRSKPLRNIIGDLGDFFRDRLLPYIERAAAQVLPQVGLAIKDIARAIKQNKPFLEEMGKALLLVGTAAVVAGILALVAAIRLIGKAIAAGIPFFHELADSVLGMSRVAVHAVTLLTEGVLTAFATIVNGAALAFGWIPGIGPKVRAAQANFHTFADNVINDLAKTSAKLKALQDQIDGLHGKTLTITVIAKEQGLDRATGPGGGMGHPGGDPKSSGSGSSTGSSTKSQVTINHATFTSTDDVLRKSQNVLRSRAGGGVILAGGNR